MKKITLSALGLFVFAAVQAQTPLVLTNSTVPVGPVSVQLGQANLNGVTLPATGANQTWNYTNLSTLSIDPLDYVMSTNPAFPAGAVVNGTGFTELVPGFGYFHDMFFTGDAATMSQVGIHVPNQDYTMAPVTGNTNDSLYIPAQTVVFNNPNKQLAYPATMGDTWQSNYQVFLNAFANAPALGLNMAPLQKRSYVVALDSVVGWGTLEVPALSGMSSMPYDVLMIKRELTTIDSLYLGNDPAPPMLVAALGQTQGAVTHDNRYIFYRENVMVPLMEMKFGSSAFTQPTSIVYQADAGMFVGTTDALQKNVQVHLYPNPATGSAVQVSFEKTDARNWQLQLIDATGRLCNKYTVSAPVGSVYQQLQLPQHISNGLYTWQLADADGAPRSTGKLSLMR